MNLFRMYWTRTLKKPGSVFLWLLIPFVFMTIYTAVFGGGGGAIPGIGLAVIDEDSSFASDFVSGAFKQGELADFIEVKEAGNLDELAELFDSEKASAGLIIPKDFGLQLLKNENTTLTLYTNPRHFIGPQIAEGVVGGLTAMANGVVGLFQQPLARIQTFVDADSMPDASAVGELAKLVYELGGQTPSFGAVANTNIKIIEEDSGEEEDFNMAAMFFPGLVAFALLSLSLSLETRFLRDRTRKVNHRIVTTPIRPLSLILQQRIYTVTFLYVIAVGTAILGGIVWDIPPVGLFNVNLISIALIMFITGINGIIFGMSNSIKATSAISSLVMMVLMVVGGGFFPVEAFPLVQGVAKVVPTGIANVGLTQSLTGRDLTISIPVLYVYSIAFFLASILVGRRKLV